MDPYLIPAQLAIIGLYLGRFAITGWLPEPLRSGFLLLPNDVKLRAGPYGKTILLPALLILTAWIIFLTVWITAFHLLPGKAIDDPVLPNAISSCLLAPVSEEIIQCVFLSSAFLIAAAVYQNRRAATLCMMAAALITISAIIASAHANVSAITWLIRFIQFLIYGGLYYLYGRNMLPAVVAHATWNGILVGTAVVG